MVHGKIDKISTKVVTSFSTFVVWGGSPGLITRVDRLEQEILRIRENRRHIIALWIAVAAVVIKEIVVWIGNG